MYGEMDADVGGVEMYTSIRGKYRIREKHELYIIGAVERETGKGWGQVLQ